MFRKCFKVTTLCYLCCWLAQTEQFAKTRPSSFLTTKQCLSSNITKLLGASLTDIDTGRTVEHLTKGGNYRFTAQFVSHKLYANRISMRLTLLIGDSEIRLPFFRKRNFCQHSSSRLQCPIRPNQFNTFQISVHIPEQTPNFNGTLQMKLLNENRERFLCTLFPLIVQ